MDGWMGLEVGRDGWTDIQTNRHIDGWMDGWMGE